MSAALFKPSQKPPGGKHIGSKGKRPRFLRGTSALTGFLPCFWRPSCALLSFGAARSRFVPPSSYTNGLPSTRRQKQEKQSQCGEAARFFDEASALLCLWCTGNGGCSARNAPKMVSLLSLLKRRLLMGCTSGLERKKLPSFG